MGVLQRNSYLLFGEDVPGAPLNVKLVATGTEGTITWNEPTTGAHDGYFDNSTLTYDVVRLLIAQRLQQELLPVL